MAGSKEKAKREPPSWVNKEFIQAALRCGDDARARVEEISVRPLLAVGENYGSDMFRATVKLQGCDEKKNLIVKTLPKGREEIAEVSNIFLREVDVFTKILPLFYKVLKEKQGENYQPFAAKCLHSGADPNIFMVLEDLSVDGFKNAPRRIGLDLTHSLMVVQTIARFHATSVVAQRQNHPTFKQFNESIFHKGNKDMLKDFTRGSVKSFVEALREWPEFDRRYGSRLLNVTDSLMEKLFAKFIYRPGKFNVFIHGDSWTNNIMFKYNEEGEPIALRLVDFQLSTFTSPAIDLQYFLNTSTTEEVRMRHWDHLISEYHSTLTDSLHSLGCHDTEYSMEQLKQDLDEYYFYGFYVVITVLPIIIADSDAGQEIKESFENIGKSDYSTKNKSMYANEKYMNRMKTLLPIFETKNIF